LEIGERWGYKDYFGLCPVNIATLEVVFLRFVVFDDEIGFVFQHPVEVGYALVDNAIVAVVLEFDDEE